MSFDTIAFSVPVSSSPWISSSVKRPRTSCDRSTSAQYTCSTSRRRCASVSHPSMTSIPLVEPGNDSPDPTSSDTESPSSSPPIDWFESASSAHGAASVPNGHCQFTSQQRTPPFFEGWYLRLILPDRRTFALIFALEAPNKGTIQVIDSDDKLYVYELPSSALFHASPASQPWSFSHWGTVENRDTTSFQARHSLHGYTTTASGSHGKFNTKLPDLHHIQWGFDYTPSLSWGPRGSGRHTGTWLAVLPVFEPGYQVLMAHGRVSSGYISIHKPVNGENDMKNGLHVDLTGATVHVEKNWGAQFPPKWFWIHCNVFDNEPDLSLIALGAKRTVVVVEETIGLIAVHHNGKLYEFSNWSAVNLDWNVRWGTWQMSSTSRTGFHVQLTGTADGQGTYVLGPTDEGMKFTMRDSMRGRLHLKLCHPDGTVIVNTCTSCAQLEMGGEPWDDDEDGTWIASVKQMKQPLRGIINLFNGSKVETD